jgi:2-methylcitrate dehydratase PrpD
MFDSVVVSLIGRIGFDPDPPPHPDRFGHRHGGTVSVTTTDGRLLSHTCKAPRGSGTTGIQWADVEDKYRALVPRAECSGDRVEQSLALIRYSPDRWGRGILRQRDPAQALTREVECRINH